MVDHAGIFTLRLEMTVVFVSVSWQSADVVSVAAKPLSHIGTDFAASPMATAQRAHGGVCGFPAVSPNAPPCKVLAPFASGAASLRPCMYAYDSTIPIFCGVSTCSLFLHSRTLLPLSAGAWFGFELENYFE